MLCHVGIEPATVCDFENHQPQPSLVDFSLLTLTLDPYRAGTSSGLISGSGSAWSNTYSLSDMSWEIPLALLLISTNWWENFCDKDVRVGCVYIPVKNYKDALHRVRTKAYILASLWKIGLTFGFAFLLVPQLSMANVAFKDLLVTPAEYTFYNGSLLNAEVVMTTRMSMDTTEPPILPDIVHVIRSPILASEDRFMRVHTQNCSVANLSLDGLLNTTVCTTSYTYNWRQYITYLPLVLQVAPSLLSLPCFFPSVLHSLYISFCLCACLQVAYLHHIYTPCRYIVNMYTSHIYTMYIHREKHRVYIYRYTHVDTHIHTPCRYIMRSIVYICVRELYCACIR